MHHSKTVDQVGWFLRLIAQESKILVTQLKEKVRVTSKELTFPGLAYDGCDKNNIHHKMNVTKKQYKTQHNTNNQTKSYSDIY